MADDNAGSTGAPPLGTRPTEPLPGKESLKDPRGTSAAATDEPGICPDCGLPFGEHPDTHLHDGSGGHPGWADVDLDAEEEQAEEEHLPGEELDPSELGGDPAAA